MRIRLGLIVFVGLLAVSALALWLASPPPLVTLAVPPVPPAPVAVETPAAPPPETASSPPDASPPPPDAGPPAVPAEPPPPQPPEPAVAAEPSLPALPELRVAERPIHEVPPEAGPPPPSSQPLEPRPAPHPTGQSAEVALGARPLTPSPLPRQFSGTAVAAGAVELKVDTTLVTLFGVKRAGDRDRCGTDAGSDCLAAARRALAERVGAAGKVSCRIPKPQGSTLAAAICLDANGVDLSGFLIAQGLALADTGQSYDYVGAEGVARNLKRGLWQFR